MFNKLVFVNAIAICALMAQSETGRAGLEGTASDASGKAIVSADISIKNTQTGLVRSLKTGADGNFHANALPVGLYTLDAAAAGFGAARVQNIALTVGETKTVNIILQVASVNTQVTVVEQAQVVNEADVSNGTTLNERAIENLPIRGRNFAQFMQLTPNSMQEQNRFGIVVNGQRSINVNISLDGVDFSDPLQGGQRGGGANQSAYFFPQMAIREFQVVRDGASAEVGRTNSGYVNVVTKSGTNSLHGEGFYNNRNGSMTSPDAFGNDTSANQQNQFGVAMGGPVKKDKVFFFGAVEKNFVTIPYTVKFNTPSGGIALPADIAAQQGTFAGKNNPLVAFGKTDYQLSQKHSLNLQYTYAAQYGLTFGGPTGQTTSSATNNTVLDRASQGVKGGLTSILGGSMVNEFRGQWAYDNRLQSPNSNSPQISFSDGFATLGGATGGTEIYKATKYQFLDNLSWNKGIHALKVGLDFNINPEEQQRETNYAGVYTFTNLGNYLAALAGDKTKISRYQQSIAANGTQGYFTGTQQDHAIFVTDTLRLNRSVTVTAGLRWAGQINPQPTSPNPKYPITAKIPNDFKMWQPRLGVAWNIGGKGTSVIRLSAGLFDAHTPGYLMQRTFTDNGLNTLVLDSNTDPSVLSYVTVPNRINALPAGVKTPINAIYAFDANYLNPRSAQVALSFEQQIDKDTKVTFGLVRNATSKLQRRIDTNLFAPTVLTNGVPVYPVYDSVGKVVAASSYNQLTGPVFLDSVTGAVVRAAVARPDTTIGAVNVNKSVGHSDYTGFSISVQRRMSHRLQFGMNYTNSYNHDDDSNERDFNRQSAYNTYGLNLDAGYSKNDIRHNGNVNFLYDLGHGFTLSSLFLAKTGSPVKAVTGVDTQNDGNTVNDLPIVNGKPIYRNTLRQPGFLAWDMRLLKEFKLGEKARVTFSLEGFNLTRASNKQFNGDGETSFGAAQAAVNPRTGYAYAGNNAYIPTNSPGTDFFGGARQAQLGIRFVY